MAGMTANYPQARNDIVCSNRHLVTFVSRRYRDCGVPEEDLIQEGTLGLITAAERFQPEKGFRFSTYATWWIRCAILKAISAYREPMRVVSLDAPVGDDDSTCLADLIGDDAEQNPANEVTRHAIRDELLAAMEVLTTQERQVITLRYGLDGTWARTPDQASRELRMNREKLVRTESLALKKLRRLVSP